MNPFKTVLISVLVMSTLADLALAKTDCKDISGHRKCNRKDECQWARKNIDSKSKSCIDDVEVSDTDIDATAKFLPRRFPMVECETGGTEEEVGYYVWDKFSSDQLFKVHKGIRNGLTQAYINDSYVPAPEGPWGEKQGCCRQKKGDQAHHDTATVHMLPKSSKSKAVAACKQKCEELKCSAYEVHKAGKKKNKKFKCETHVAAIDSATRRSKTCKTAQCFFPKKAEPQPLKSKEWNCECNAVTKAIVSLAGKDNGPTTNTKGQTIDGWYKYCDYGSVQIQVNFTDTNGQRTDGPCDRFAAILNSIEEIQDAGTVSCFRGKLGVKADDGDCTATAAAINRLIAVRTPEFPESTCGRRDPGPFPTPSN